MVCKKSLLLLCCMMALCLLFSCKKKNENIELSNYTYKPVVQDSDDAIMLHLGFSTNMEDPRALASLLFQKEVDEKTNGRIKIVIHPNGELGSDSELIESVLNDTLDLTVSSAGNFGVYATKLGISAMPFLFSDFESAWEFMDSPFIAKINESLAEYNMIVLSHYDNGFRCVTTTSRPVKSVSDMAGLNIRTPPNQIVMETMLVLGANPKPYAFNELKGALRSGLFDSQENPIPVIYNSALYEEQKYLSITNHSYDAMPLVIRKSLWDKLSPADRDVLLEAAKKAQNEDRRLVKEQTESYVGKLKEKGMTIIYPDLEPFVDATSGVIDTFSNVYGEDVINEFRTIIEN